MKYCEYCGLFEEKTEEIERIVEKSKEHGYICNICKEELGF